MIGHRWFNSSFMREMEWQYSAKIVSVIGDYLIMKLSPELN
jgi:hypothetical protein